MSRFFVASLNFAGWADNSDAFHDLLLAALGGDVEATAKLHVGPIHVVRTPERDETEEAE